LNGRSWVAALVKLSAVMEVPLYEHAVPRLHDLRQFLQHEPWWNSMSQLLVLMLVVMLNQRVLAW